MTRKETALDALNRKIPKLEEKINQDKQLLEELKAQKESLEFEAFKKYLRDNGMTTEEAIAKLETIIEGTARHALERFAKKDSPSHS